MASPSTATVLDREFLSIRCALLDLAAALDRVDRDTDRQLADPRRQAIANAIAILTRPEGDRAAGVQMVFSLPYQDQWRTQFEL